MHAPGSDALLERACASPGGPRGVAMATATKGPWPQVSILTGQLAGWGRDGQHPRSRAGAEVSPHSRGRATAQLEACPCGFLGHADVWVERRLNLTGLRACS